MQNHIKAFGIVASLFGLVACSATAADVTWTGGGGNDNWSTLQNWLGGAPAGNSLFFNDTDATGSPGATGTANNIVDSSLAVQSLKYGNTNGFHTTRILQGVALTLNGTANPILFTGTGTDNDALQVNATILGQGSLLVTNPSAAIVVIQGDGNVNNAMATLDMAGLDRFTAHVSQIRIAGENGNGTTSPWYNRPGGHLLLARTNVISMSSSSAGLLMGRAQSNGGNALCTMGETNAFFTDAGITVGSRKAGAGTMLRFNPAFSSSVAYFRNLDGTGRQNSWILGDNNEQSGGGTFSQGTADFSGGTVDALVNTMVIGRSVSGTGGSAICSGTLTFEAGVIDVNTVDVGVRSGGPATGTINVNGTARLVVNNVLRLAPAGGSPTTEGALYVNGGAVHANSISSSIDGQSVIYLTGGTLAVTNTAGTPETPLFWLSADGASTLALSVTPGQTNMCVTEFSGNGEIDILSLPAILSFPAQYPLISYVNGGGDFVIGALPPPYQGFISNNTTAKTIDIVVTDGPKNIAWNGNINGDWSGPQNWLLSGVSASYNQYDSVLFDDNATGTTTVNLNAALTPSGIFVNNGAKLYTFSGSGSLEGTAGLIKANSGTLVIGNSGVNTFSGDVTIEAGKIQLSGSANRLPTNTVVTLADLSGAALDLNGVNQTIASLNGGGAAGGNVTLGAATLTFGEGSGAYNGVISGSGAVAKTGSGKQVLGSANTYEGGTVIAAGTLAVTNSIGSGTGSGSIVVHSNATLSIGDGGIGGSVATGQIQNEGTVEFDRSDDFTLANVIVGGGGVTKNNTNLITIPISNTYTGYTTINAGGLRVSNPAGLGTADAGTEIENHATARLEITGGITLQDRLIVNQKQTAAGNAPCVLNLSGNNTLTGGIDLQQGGSHWIFQSASGKLIVDGPVINSATSNTRTLWLSGPSDGEWNGGLLDGSGSIAALRKDGSGTWTLGGVSTYTGSTVVSNGTLRVNGAILGGVVHVYGGILAGTGAISVPTTIYADGTLAPGDSVGKLSINNNLTLQGTTVMELSKTGSVTDNDEISVVGVLTLGGTLDISLSGTVSGGEVFQLFTATAFAGAGFDQINLPALPDGLNWDDSELASTGVLKISATTAPALSVSQSGDVLTFSWTQPGYRLQAQTNAPGVGLTGAWFDYPGGNTSGVNAPIDRTTGSVFYRLIQE